MVNPHNLYLTIKFLGDMEEAALRGMEDELRHVLISFSSFSLPWDRLGAFPSAKNARVIWLGTPKATYSILTLHQTVEIIAAKHGASNESKLYHPHITIARISTPMTFAEEQNLPVVYNSPCNALPLFTSQLKKTGAIHSVFAQIPFRQEPR